MASAQGILAKNRERLETLHRRFPGPFSVSDAAAAWALDARRTGRILAHFAARGWLSRIRRNAYKTVPLGATAPHEWREDPWVVAATTFSPCYLAGWTAAEHWELTDQIFSDVQVVTSRNLRRKVYEIQGTRFVVKAVAKGQLFGVKTIWRADKPVTMSDPERTVADILDDPRLAGGIRHGADMLEAYLGSAGRNDTQLVEYSDRIGNRTAFKRLGYLLDALDIEAPELRAACKERLSAGISLLDPGGKKTGPIVSRWGLRVNARIEPRHR